MSFMYKEVLLTCLDMSLVMPTSALSTCTGTRTCIISLWFYDLILKMLINIWY